MKADLLRMLQAPLKDQYRQDPSSALVTMHARGELGDGLSCTVKTDHATVVSSLHPAAGGDGKGACSGDMLLAALIACAGVTLGAVATALGIELRDAKIDAEGDVDFRGTLGVDKTASVGFDTIRLTFAIRSNASEEQLATLQKLTERYCVVYQTLRNAPAIEVQVRPADPNDPVP